MIQLDPSSIEVSICADAPLELLDALALTYLGTVPPVDPAKKVKPTVVLTPPASSPPEKISVDQSNLGLQMEFGKNLGVYTHTASTLQSG